MKSNHYLRAYYADLVHSYVLNQEERFLSMAADLGRSALRREVPLEEIVELHDQILLDLAKSRPDFSLSSAIKLASPPLMRMLTAYGEAFREQLEQQRSVETQLLHAKDAAELASRAKSDFLAGMSHELRTPLNAIIGFSDIIASEIFGPIGTERYREDARNIGEAGRHLLELISDILDISKMGSGQLALDETDIDLMEVIPACTRMLKIRAEEAGLRVIIDVAPGLPRLRADALRVKQMLLNLISNATKFTSAGGTISVTAHENEKDEIVISVTDTGIGMSSEDIPRALSPFVQLDSVMTRRYGGPGIGLALVNSLIELHDGTLEINSQPGIGTEATLRFPAVRAVRATYCI
ncbi:MAG: HAMP domain-containing histidine kinase [Alphaproteobacteria bacterium]|nr:HAMP domain-containing histidine kinase [Alphaproteobacteria bacterium]